MHAIKRIPISGIPNMRDLGGWPLDGGMTKWGVFFRSALPSGLDESDISALEQLGISTVLDLRSPEECLRAPDALSNVPGIEYINVPMFDAAAAGGALRIEPEENFSWGRQYIRMAEEKKPWMAAVMELLACSRGAALWHCTTGKDRAGLITALVLSLCGAAKEDIAADYCVSQVYLRERYRQMEQANNFTGGDLDAPFYRTQPGTILSFLDHLDGAYGGTKNYLLHCGTDESALESIRKRLVENF